MAIIRVEDLLAGSSVSYEITLPAQMLAQGEGAVSGTPSVRIRPLTLHDLELIGRAARDSEGLTAALMVQQALVEPAMSVAQVSAMQVGLVQFLLAQVNRVSGIMEDADHLAQMAEEPLAVASYLLEREFGWTPKDIADMTMGQILLHLRMMRDRMKP